MTVETAGRAHRVAALGVAVLTFELFGCVAALAAGLAPPTNYPVGDNAQDVAVADLNTDGLLDLAVAQIAGVSILLGNKGGTFQAAVTYPAGNSPFSVAVGDFNEDGKPDLAVSCQSGMFTTSIVAILLGNGDGTFQTAVEYLTGTNPVSLAIGEFNGDANLDLATANTSANNVSILLGNGDGTFQNAVAYPTGGNGVSIAVGSFDSDGDADLAVANGGFDNVAVLLGTGVGAFQAPVGYATGTAPRSVIVEDFDTDGAQDLAVANAGSNDVSILMGSGTGTFADAVHYPAGAGSVAVAAADFDGDGRKDLAVVNPGSDTVAILRGGGTGTFQAPVNYGVGTDPFAVSPGDFDGDGKPDLAVVNYGSSTVSVLLNNKENIELQHGAGRRADLQVRPQFYRFAQQPYTSHEITIDGTSGDVDPVLLQRLSGDSVTVLQTAEPTGAGASVSMRWQNPTSVLTTNQHIRVDGSCLAPCGSDDVYRIRAYETTYRLTRFSNAGSQVTVLLLQNTTSQPVTGTVFFWSANGTLLANHPFMLAARAQVVLNTSTVGGLSGQAGTATVVNNARYGELAGKGVAIEPSTGFSFDTPLQPRPR